MSNKTIFKNTDRVRKAGVPQGKPADYKISKTVITGEPVNKADFKRKPLIQKPTISERAEKFKSVFDLDKKFSRGGKVYK